LIQRTRHLDSIVARALLVAEFFDSIGQKPTSAGHASMSEKSREADIELSYVKVFLNRPSLLWKDGLPAP
jgi:hypothetical protein